MVMVMVMVLLSPTITRNLAPPLRVIWVWPSYRQWAAVTTYRWGKTFAKLWSLTAVWQMSSKAPKNQYIFLWSSSYPNLIEDGSPTHEAPSLFVTGLVEKGVWYRKKVKVVCKKSRKWKWVGETHRNQNLVGKLVLGVHFLASDNSENSFHFHSARGPVISQFDIHWIMYHCRLTIKIPSVTYQKKTLGHSCRCW